MPEEIAFARQRQQTRRNSFRADGSFAFALAISGVLLLVPALVGWNVGKIGGAAGLALAVLAGATISVLLTFTAARAWLRFSKSDRIFPDATLTGWIRRARAERSVAHARELFSDPSVAPIELHVEKLIALANSMEARDARTHRHSRRVALNAVAAGEELGLSETELTRLRAAAMLHDLGPDLIEFTGDREMISALRHQEEHFDGSGEPDRLRGERIPLMSRIIAVANEYDLVAREQNQAAAFAALAAGEGSRFDPIVVEALIAAAQASPATALRGAFVGAFPRAAQGAADLLRGSAGVVAAASIATTAVVAGTAASTPPQKHSSQSAGQTSAAAASAGAVAGSQTSTGKKQASGQGRDSAPTSEHGTAKNTTEKHSSTPTTGGTKGADAAPSSSTETKSGGGESTPQKKSTPTPVQDLTQGVDDTVDNTTQTVGGVVDDVTKTVDDTVNNTTGTVNGVVGGLTGKK
jgi:hypothetical protein